jgi:hypothetical protein
MDALVAALPLQSVLAHEATHGTVVRVMRCCRLGEEVMAV